MWQACRCRAPQGADEHPIVDGSLVGAADETMLKDRRILRDEGFVSIVVVRDPETGKIISGPDIHARGVSEGEKILQRAVPKVEQALEEARLTVKAWMALGMPSQAGAELPERASSRARRWLEQLPKDFVEADGVAPAEAPAAGSA